MKTVLVLGHKGMLGNAVHRYLNETGKYTVITTDARFGDAPFTETLKATEAEFIINCIGIIPQKKPTADDYRKINIELPIFLETLGKKIIHPSTDCEFAGTIPLNAKYAKNDVRDATDEYGKSKADISKFIETSFKNTKIIRTSIIGHELSTNVALLDWFLHSEERVKGYTNHYWNGITTLQWAKLCEEIIADWDSYPILNQYGTDKVASKYELLKIFQEVYGESILIDPFEPPHTVNKCLESDKQLPDLTTQLTELKNFYKK